MRLRVLGSLFILAASAWPAHAQPRSATASHAMIAAALEEQGVLFLRQQDTYSFTLRNQQVTLRSVDNGSRLVIKAAVKRIPPLDPLNLETGLDCKTGVTAAGLQKFLTGFGNDLATFEPAAAAPPVKPSTVDPMADKIKVPLEMKSGSDDKEFIIRFPTNVPAEKALTAWKIIWAMETGKEAADQGFQVVRPSKKAFKFGMPREQAVVLFKIKQAFFKPGPDADWIQVLEDAHPQEFYVPYFFAETRFFDLRDYGHYVPLSAKEGGRVSQTLSKDQRVMAELRDRGVAYKHGNTTRRGEELTLWANFQAANYTYMIEFGFHDDGTIVFRHAPTGMNLVDHFNASHMHGSYWRIGVKLGPEGRNDRNLVQVVRLPKAPKDQANPNGKLVFEELTKESFVDWNAEDFTRLRVTNPYYYIVPEGKGRPSQPISYDLVTVAQGVSRHARYPDEKFTQHDFWITRHDCPEKTYINLGKYFQNGEGDSSPNVLPLDGQNVTLWHSSSALHTPRSEDGIVGGRGINSGQALIYWTSFELRPRNLFLKTPLYGATH